MRTGVVYILQCSDGSFYTGVTNDLDRRLSEHAEGLSGAYTKTRRPVKCVWVSDELDIQDAIVLEKQVKGWRRAKKLALIQDRVHDLPFLSACYSKTALARRH